MTRATRHGLQCSRQANAVHSHVVYTLPQGISSYPPQCGDRNDGIGLLDPFANELVLLVPPTPQRTTMQQRALGQQVIMSHAAQSLTHAQPQAHTIHRYMPTQIPPADMSAEEVKLTEVLHQVLPVDLARHTRHNRSFATCQPASCSQLGWWASNTPAQPVTCPGAQAGCVLLHHCMHACMHLIRALWRHGKRLRIGLLACVRVATLVGPAGRGGGAARGSASLLN
jgi:hypothetical protein